jgi:uncharacterized OB-fold protein
MASRDRTPPSQRTTVWAPLSAAARQAEFILQICENCGSLQYPPRELCKDCLADKLVWKRVINRGKLISHTVLHASTNAFFRKTGPRQIALVKLDAGVILFAHLASKDAKTGERIYLLNMIDLSGEAVFVAIVEDRDEKTQLDELKILLSQND